MISYQVHAHVAHQIYDEFVSWMGEVHIPELLKVDGFIDAELLYRKGGSIESSGKEVKIIYHLKSEEALKTYLAGSAMKIREKVIEKFPGQFSMHREVWLESIKF